MNSDDVTKHFWYIDRKIERKSWVVSTHKGENHDTITNDVKWQTPRNDENIKGRIIDLFALLDNEKATQIGFQKDSNFSPFRPKIRGSHGQFLTNVQRDPNQSYY